MRAFESFLAPQLREYIAYREMLGYAKNPVASFLLRFDRYLKEQMPHSDNTTAVALRVISLQQPQRSGRQQTKSKKPGKHATLDDAIAEIEHAIKTYEKEMKE